MSQTESDALWARVRTGLSDEQERIDAAVLAGTSKEAKYVPFLLDLLNDDSAHVRYCALQCLVLDLDQKGADMAAFCWEILQADPDEYVRGMAGSCLGSIYFGKRSREIFRRVLGELKNPSQPPLAKAALYTNLFELAGRPPAEWPGLQAKKVFEESDIDWEKVAWLEDQMVNP